MAFIVEGAITVLISDKEFILTGTISDYLVVAYHAGPDVPEIEIGSPKETAEAICTTFEVSKADFDAKWATFESTFKNVPVLKDVAPKILGSNVSITDIEFASGPVLTVGVGFAMTFDPPATLIGNLEVSRIGVKFKYIKDKPATPELVLTTTKGRALPPA